MNTWKCPYCASRNFADKRVCDECRAIAPLFVRSEPTPVEVAALRQGKRQLFGLAWALTIYLRLGYLAIVLVFFGAAYLGIAWLSGGAAAQQSQPIALTEQEQREALDARQAIEQAQASLNQVGNIVLTADVSDCAKPAVAVALAQIRQLRLQLAAAQAGGLLWRLRAAHGCTECEYSPDYKSLVKGK